MVVNMLEIAMFAEKRARPEPSRAAADRNKYGNYGEIKAPQISRVTAER